jgi:phosphotransferase system enzyme I (PtsI)
VPHGVRRPRASGTVLRSVSLAEARELAGLAVNALTAAGGREAVRSRLPMLAELGV